MAETTETKTDWRIEVKRPGTRKWEYLPFTGSVHHDEDNARRALTRERGRLPEGWKLRLMRRETTITHTPWEECE